MKNRTLILLTAFLWGGFFTTPSAAQDNLGDPDMPIIDPVQELCDSYAGEELTLEPEGVAPATLRHITDVVATYYGEEVDLAGDPELVERLTEFLVIGADCQAGTFFFDVSDYFAFDDDLAPIPYTDETFEDIAILYGVPTEDMTMGTTDLPGGDPPPDDGAPPQDPMDMDSASPGPGMSAPAPLDPPCYPLHTVIPNGGHPWAVDCPPASIPIPASPHGIVTVDFNRCFDGSDTVWWDENCQQKTPGRRYLANLALDAGRGQEYRWNQEVAFREHWRDVGQTLYMTKPILVGTAKAATFALTKKGKGAGSVMVGTISAVGDAISATTGVQLVPAGVQSIMDGIKQFDPVEIAGDATAWAVDQISPGLQDMAQQMIGENAELASFAAGQALLQRGRNAQLEQLVEAAGGRMGLPLTDMACNNMDAWFHK